MQPRYPAPKQPSQSEIQSLLNLYNSGQLMQAETTARMLLKLYPNVLMFHNVLGVALEGQRKFEEAVTSYRRALALNPSLAELHFNLGVVLSHLGKLSDAVTSYKRAVAIKPGLAVGHFNLGIALQGLGKNQEAAACYRKAVAIEPGFFEAYGNLGTVLQKQGLLDEAVASYAKALAINPDARGHFNLATALRDQGKLEEAIASYRRAIAIKPDYAEAHNNLGEVLRDQGRMEEAVQSYRDALAVEPGNTQASFNIAQFLYDAGRLEQAIPHFEKSRLGDWRERILYCLYKTGNFTVFKNRLQQVISEKDSPDSSPFLATLSAHYAANFGVEDPYNFCRNPLDFVYHNSITPLAAPDSQLLGDLLRDITHAEIAERKQGRLHNGIQSAGNLFKRPEPSFKQLASLIKREVEAYRKQFAAEKCELMKSFPRDIEFTSSWYVKMRQGGHLTSHIHEIGWLSGCVYLTLPQDKAGSDDGSIEFSTHGDDYPRQHHHFPVKTIAPAVGDIVLFPSSLFHRTVPFSSDEDRICIAFDIKPAEQPRARFDLKMLLLGGWMYAMDFDLVEVVLQQSSLLA